MGRTVATQSPARSDHGAALAHPGDGRSKVRRVHVEASRAAIQGGNTSLM
jgi:hypothetical protein